MSGVGVIPLALGILAGAFMLAVFYSSKAIRWIVARMMARAEGLDAFGIAKKIGLEEWEGRLELRKKATDGAVVKRHRGKLAELSNIGQEVGS